MRLFLFPYEQLVFWRRVYLINEQIFDNSLEKGKPNDIRITGLGPGGDTNVIPGLDEGVLTMRSGGIRRLYIPGELAFPKGLASAPVS